MAAFTSLLKRLRRLSRSAADGGGGSGTPGEGATPDQSRGESARDTWERTVADALEDPDSDAFIAYRAALMILGGEHTRFGYCWCYPDVVDHEEHRHFEHRVKMD